MRGAQFFKQIPIAKFLKTPKLRPKSHTEDLILLHKKFKKIQIPISILIFRGPILQLVQNIKPIKKLLCTDSSCNQLGIYVTCNIYNFPLDLKSQKFVHHPPFTTDHQNKKNVSALKSKILIKYIRELNGALAVRLRSISQGDNLIFSVR